MEEEGIVDLPMRLLIVAAILVFTVPVVLGVVNYYSAAADEEQLAAGVNYLKQQIKIVFAQGDNASMVVRVSFPYGTDFVKIGGKLGTADAHLIKYKMRNGVERYTVVNYGNLGIQMTDNGKTLWIVGGTYNLVITKMKAPIDLNGDGLLNDYYINIQVRKV